MQVEEGRVWDLYALGKDAVINKGGLPRCWPSLEMSVCREGRQTRERVLQRRRLVE
jgi:hypothetical protein